MTSLKRPLASASDGFFAKKSSKLSFQWQGVEDESCLWGRCGDPDLSLRNVAAFDLDGVLIKTKNSHHKIARTREDWEWWDTRVLPKVREVARKGSHQIVIFTNQALEPKSFANWKLKVTDLGPILNVPFTIFAAADIDRNRKPLVGMWDILLKQMAPSLPDLDNSFFVGDAAGRASDHSDSDRKLAENIGIPFFTPEEYFLGQKCKEWEYRPSSFHPKMLKESKSLWSPSSASLVSKSSNPEIVLFVGPPGVGKSTFYRTHLKKHDYQWVNQDTLRTREACLNATEAHIKKGCKVVVDNTNRNIETRAYYIAMARKLNVRIRIMWFTASIELAKHQNIYRAFVQPANQNPKALIPHMAYSSYALQFECPDQESEKFDELIKIHFKFNGSAEERIKWFRWLDLNGRKKVPAREHIWG